MSALRSVPGIPYPPHRTHQVHAGIAGDMILVAIDVADDKRNGLARAA